MPTDSRVGGEWITRSACEGGDSSLMTMVTLVTPMARSPRAPAAGATPPPEPGRQLGEP